MIVYLIFLYTMDIERSNGRLFSWTNSKIEVSNQEYD